ncbi:uncharacterized protein [Lepeophtheirus salmonis]|nr:uncharacterized protein LOC121129531 [Lepeophtheirus salmonis]XP_040581294.1 uncharacterized protein LOC121129531 [Lepeophtheirus salmonis]
MVGLGKFNKMKSKGPVGKSIKEAAALAAEANKAMADEAIRGISEGSIIAGDLGGLDTNYQLMWEAADKMDDEEEDRKTSIGGMSRDFSEDWEKESDDETEDKILEQIDDRRLITRIEQLENEKSKLVEKILKLEESRTGTEKRIKSLQTEINEIRTKLEMDILYEVKN